MLPEVMLGFVQKAGIEPEGGSLFTGLQDLQDLQDLRVKGRALPRNPYFAYQKRAIGPLEVRINYRIHAIYASRPSLYLASIDERGNLKMDAGTGACSHLSTRVVPQRSRGGPFAGRGRASNRTCLRTARRFSASGRYLFVHSSTHRLRLIRIVTSTSS